MSLRALSWRHERGTCALHLGAGACERALDDLAASRPSAVAMLVDEAVLSAHRTRLEAVRDRLEHCALLAVPSGEKAKQFLELERVLERIAALGLDRQGAVLAIGGGACTDLAGLAAALWMRGIRWVAVPTTLLAMVDASVGGKTAINVPAGKNLVGAFHAPQCVAIDPTFLDSLPPREICSGLAEVVKAAILSAGEEFAWLERVDVPLALDAAAWVQVIEPALRMKIDVVEVDERESGPRRALNLGHTLAHGLEQACGFGELRHGEAVSIGIIAAADFALVRGLLSRGARERIARLLLRFGLPLAPPRGTDVEAVLRAMRLDKKSAGGRWHYVLPRGLPAASTGDVAFVDDVGESEVERWLYSSIEISSASNQ